MTNRVEVSQKSLSILQVEIIGRSICQPNLSLIKYQNIYSLFLEI